MKKYNLFVLLPNIPDEQAEGLGQQISELIKKVGGQVEKLDKYGKRKLSYAVKKVRHGFYLDFVLNLDKENIKKLQDELKLNPEVLRFELSNYVEIKRPQVREGDKRYKKTAITEDTEKTSASAKATADRRRTQKKDRPKISMEELGKKLDNILETEDI